MERFLSQCAKYINEKHGSELHEICLVFPNRRAGVFFNSYLQHEISKPVIGAQLVTVNELISGYSDLQQGEKLQLISELYEEFRQHTQTKETFDEFYFWGEVLLADFNDVDRYLVNAKDLFTNIADLKELETLFEYLTEEQKQALARFWGSVAVLEKKENQQKFVQIWQKLYSVYAGFKKRLSDKGIAYGGMVYRSVVEGLEQNQFNFPAKQYYIIGLNALNTCEVKFFSRMVKEQKASFLWDFHPLYVHDTNNEAGRFLRDNLKRFPPPEDFKLDLTGFENDKQITLMAVSSNHGQAQVIPRFLEKVKPGFKTEFDNTAVVLADESLLFPVLGAIPAEFGTVNVTMGYPVKNSVVYGFLALLINLLRNRKNNAENETVVYHRFVTDVLNHQLLGNVEPEKTKQFLQNLKINNRITVPLNEIDFSPLHRLIFRLPENVENYSAWFLEILSAFYERINSQTKNDMLLELIYSIYKAVEKLQSVIQNVQKEQSRTISDAVFFRLFNQYLGQVSVSFEGEPLSGMQVMGILESRCLDFKNLVIIGLNEDKWPRKFTAPTFIPFNLRKGFGLPGIDEQDAMYAYYFYRLIQRAEHVTATYSTLKEGISTGELSRFGFQLFYDSKMKTEVKSLDFSFSSDPVQPIEISNSAKMLKALLERNSAQKPFSPTALNTYLQCSLRFYFKYILQLPEPDEVKDEIDSPVFGNIFHETIEMLYKPFVGKVVNKSDVENIQKDKIRIENEILKAIGKHYFKYKTPVTKPVKPEGKTILIYENTKLFLNRLLEIDKDYAPFQLHSLEQNYNCELQLEMNGQPLSVFIGGKIDRVDRVNGQWRILDYKTGYMDKFSFKTVEELFEKDVEKPKKEILQALFYSLILKNNLKNENDFHPAIYNLRKFFDESHSPDIKWNNREFSFHEVEQDFVAHLKTVFEEIFAEESSFYQTPHEKVCQYCAYNKICQRY